MSLIRYSDYKNEARKTKKVKTPSKNNEDPFKKLGKSNRDHTRKSKKLNTVAQLKKDAEFKKLIKDCNIAYKECKELDMNDKMFCEYLVEQNLFPDRFQADKFFQCFKAQITDTKPNWIVMYSKG